MDLERFGAWLAGIANQPATCSCNGNKATGKQVGLRLQLGDLEAPTWLRNSIMSSRGIRAAAEIKTGAASVGDAARVVPGAFLLHRMRRQSSPGDSVQACRAGTSTRRSRFRVSLQRTAHSKRLGWLSAHGRGFERELRAETRAQFILLRSGPSWRQTRPSRHDDGSLRAPSTFAPFCLTA